ncbi:MAG: glycosyltransferase [Gemmatimonadaceae bacterium]|nr:glycosyltransferase [Gemmatimonadaceae bacterium]
MKILMVNLSFLPDSVGGTEVYTYHLSRALIAAGHSVTVFTAVEDMTATRYEIRRSMLDGISLIKVVNSPAQARKFTDYFKDVHTERVFREVIREECPDVVHFQHLAYLSGAMPEIAFQEGFPSILTLHDYWYICRRSHLIRPSVGICEGPMSGTNCATCLDKPLPNTRARDSATAPEMETNSGWIGRALRWLDSARRYPSIGLASEFPDSMGVDHVALAENRFRHEFFSRQLRYPAVLLSPSRYLKARYEAEGFPPISVLPLGFSRVDPVPPVPYRGTLRIAFIGNLLRTKGAHVILGELEELGRRGSEVEVHIHGWGADKLYLAELQSAVRRYPTGAAWLHGPYQGDADLGSILSSVHLTVFPSLWEENYPLVVREALQRGVPVVGSKYGGVPEAIVHGVNGCLFDPHLQGDLRHTISEIIRQPDRLEALRAGARRTDVETQDAHVRKLMDIYESVTRNVVDVDLMGARLRGLEPQ